MTKTNPLNQDEAQIAALAAALQAERDGFEEISADIESEDAGEIDVSFSDEEANVGPAEGPEVAPPAPTLPVDVVSQLVSQLQHLTAITVIATDGAGQDHVLQTTMPIAQSVWHAEVLRITNHEKLTGR